MADVYVAYSKWDRARVAPLVALLEREGWSVWWDARVSAGEGWDDWDETAAREAEEAKCILVAWSVSAIDSRWVLGEARDGFGRGILVPVLVGTVTPPPLFAKLATVDLTAWKGDAAAPEARALIAAVHRTAGPPGLWEEAKAAHGAPEVDHWNAIKTSGRHTDFERFLSDHPTGPLADPARTRAEQLKLFDAPRVRPKEKTSTGRLWLLAVALLALVGASTAFTLGPWMSEMTSDYSGGGPAWLPPSEPAPTPSTDAYAPAPPPPEPAHAGASQEAQPQDGAAFGDKTEVCPKDEFSCRITPGCTWWDDLRICVGQGTDQQQAPAQEQEAAPAPLVQCPVDEAACRNAPECTWVDFLNVCVPASSGTTEAPAESPAQDQSQAPVDCMSLGDEQSCATELRCQWYVDQCLEKVQ